MTSEQNARYYLTHREEILARAKEYYRAHTELIRAYHRKYHKANPEKKKAHGRAYYKANAEKWKEYDRKIRITHPERKRDNFCKRRYGISLSDYRAMVDKQEGKCLICGEIPKGKLYIDHDHETGKFRGLICHNCNLGLGSFKDNLEILRRAVDYLTRAGGEEEKPCKK